LTPSSPHTQHPPTPHPRSDLNTLLASWANIGCTGSITFTTTTPQTYQLTDVYDISNGGNWTLDATGSAGVTLKAAAGKRIITGGSRYGQYMPESALTLKGLTFQGSGVVPYPGGGLIFVHGPTFTATDCVFMDGAVSAFRMGGGCLDIWNSP
jgi:hypothetical protein